MKKMVMTALAVASLTAAAFAADKKQLSFSNEISSDVVHHISPKDSDEDGHTRFAGITDEVIADYDGGVIKVGVDAIASFYDTNEYDDDAPFKIDWTDDIDFYVEFNPFQMVGFGWSDELYTEGSYLPVLDDNISVGNYSTNGFAVLIRPVEGLTFGAGVDFPATLFSDDDDEPNAYEVAIGADYTSDDIAIGGSIRHIGTDDALQAGAYVSLKMIDKLMLNFGFTHAENGDVGLGEVTFLAPYSYWTEDDGSGSLVYIYGPTGINGENIFSAGVTYDAGKFQLGADLATNLDGDDSVYDFYTALDFAMGLTQRLTLDIKGLLLYDFGENSVWNPAKGKMRALDPTVGIYPKIVFAMNDHHEFSAGLKLQSCIDSDYGYTTFALPVSWKYTY